MALNPSQAQTAQLIYTLAKARGLPDQRAREMVAASYAESGLNPSARNKSSGASGLFQLLSSGYVNRANAQGGTTNPKANFNAIAPDYVSYWQSHPNAAPGEAAAAVERSGAGSSFYSAPLAKIGALGAARSPGVDSLTSLGLSSSSAAQPAAGSDPSLRRAFAMQLIAANQAGQGGRTVDYAPVLQSLSALRQGGQAVDSQPMNAAPPGAGMPGAGTSSGHISPVQGDYKFGRIDQGVDVSQSHPYVAPGAGTVTRIGKVAGGTNLGVYVKLDQPIQVNGRSYPGIYVWHTSPLVKPGQRVQAGQPIMSAGSAEVGFATADGRPVAPLVGGLGAGTQPTSSGQDMLAFFKSRRP